MLDDDDYKNKILSHTKSRWDSKSQRTWENSEPLSWGPQERKSSARSLLNGAVLAKVSRQRWINLPRLTLRTTSSSTSTATSVTRCRISSRLLPCPPSSCSRGQARQLPDTKVLYLIRLKNSLSSTKMLEYAS